MSRQYILLVLDASKQEVAQKRYVRLWLSEAPPWSQDRTPLGTASISLFEHAYILVHYLPLLLHNALQTLCFSLSTYRIMILHNVLLSPFLCI